MGYLAQSVVEFYKDADAITSTTFCAPCSSSCPVNITESGSKEVDGSEYLALSRTIRNICPAITVNVLITHDSFNIVGNRFLVTADGATIYNSTCIVGSGSATFAIPAGTDTVAVLVYGNCNLVGGGAADLWSISMGCL